MFQVVFSAHSCCTCLLLELHCFIGQTPAAIYLLPRCQCRLTSCFFFFLRVRMTEFNFSHGNVSSEEFHLPKCIVLLKMYFSIQHNLEDFLIPIFFFFFWVRMIEFTFSHGNKGKKLKLFGNFHNP